MALRYRAHPTTNATLNGVTPGSVVAGNSVDIGDNARQKVRGLSAYVAITLNSANLTAVCKWQVSNDGSTWVDVANGSQNAAGVTLGTGSISALTKVVEAPSAVYGWRRARLAITTGGATGSSSDVYEISYNYRSGM